MTAYTLQAPIPAIPVVEGMILKLEAVSPTTALPVAGVTATEWAIYGVNVSAEPDTPGELPSWVPDGDQEV